MTTVFLYESLTGGGTLLEADREPPQGSLLAEGRAMALALADDLLAAGCRPVLGTWDSRLPAPPHRAGLHWTSVGSPREHDGILRRHARQADCTLVIAPEWHGHLARTHKLLEGYARRILGVDRDVLAWASHKQRTAERLADAGIPCPAGQLVAAGQQPAASAGGWPLIVKPLDGAGSIGVRCLGHPEELSRFFPSAQELRLETYCPGLPASVMVLTGARGPVLLPTCLQRIAGDGSFAYQGGEVLADGALLSRGHRLAQRVAQLLPECTGFVGIDLILGPSADGAADFVVEVNPRLTTSYLGLRAATQDNLAAAMLQVAAGSAPPELTFADRPRQFTADDFSGAA